MCPTKKYCKENVRRQQHRNCDGKGMGARLMSTRDACSKGYECACARGLDTHPFLSRSVRSGCRGSIV